MRMDNRTVCDCLESSKEGEGMAVLEEDSVCQKEGGGAKLVLLTKVEAKLADNLSQTHQRLNPSSWPPFD